MKVLQAAFLNAALFAALAAAAGAAEPTSTTPQNRSQIATNPGTLGPKNGPSNWMPAAPSTTTPNSGAETEGYYSRKGFGPNPDCSSSTTC